MKISKLFSTLRDMEELDGCSYLVEFDFDGSLVRFHSLSEFKRYIRSEFNSYAEFLCADYARNRVAFTWFGGFYSYTYTFVRGVSSTLFC